MALGFRSFKGDVNKLRLPTVVEKAVDVNTSSGGTSRAWQATTGTIYIYDLPLLLSEFDTAGQVRTQVRHEVTLRYMDLSLIGGDLKYRFNGPFGIWYIQDVVDPLNTRQWLACVCQEQVA